MRVVVRKDSRRRSALSWTEPEAIPGAVFTVPVACPSGPVYTFAADKAQEDTLLQPLEALPVWLTDAELAAYSDESVLPDASNHVVNSVCHERASFSTAEAHASAKRGHAAGSSAPEHVVVGVMGLYAQAVQRLFRGEATGEVSKGGARNFSSFWVHDRDSVEKWIHGYSQAVAICACIATLACCLQHEAVLRGVPPAESLYINILKMISSAFSLLLLLTLSR